MNVSIQTDIVWSFMTVLALVVGVIAGYAEGARRLKRALRDVDHITGAAQDAKTYLDTYGMHMEGCAWYAHEPCGCGLHVAKYDLHKRVK